MPATELDGDLLEHRMTGVPSSRCSPPALVLHRVHSGGGRQSRQRGSATVDHRRRSDGSAQSPASDRFPASTTSSAARQPTSTCTALRRPPTLTPTVVQLAPGVSDEASGIAASTSTPGAYFLIDDGTGTDSVAAVGSDGALLARIAVDGLSAGNAEALSAGSCGSNPLPDDATGRHLSLRRRYR